MRSTDIVSSILLFSFSIIMIIVCLEYPFGNPSNPGPGFLPSLSLAILGILSLLLFLRSSLSGENRRIRVKISSEGLSWDRLLATLAAIFGYVIALEFLGYAATTFVFLVSILKGIEKTKWYKAVAGALLTTALTHVVFGIWLRVPLPKGIWVRLF